LQQPAASAMSDSFTNPEPRPYLPPDQFRVIDRVGVGPVPFGERPLAGSDGGTTPAVDLERQRDSWSRSLTKSESTAQCRGAGTRRPRRNLLADDVETPSAPAVSCERQLHKLRQHKGPNQPLSAISRSTSRPSAEL
jgi:hypothetical protein